MANRPDDLRVHLRSLEEQLLRPAVRKSLENLDGLLADEFVEFTSSGRVYDKQQIVAALQEQSPAVITLSDFHTRWLSDDVALATYRAIKQVQGKTASSLRCSIWKLIDGRWQIVFHQGTPAE